MEHLELKIEIRQDLTAEVCTAFCFTYRCPPAVACGTLRMPLSCTGRP